MIHQSNECQRYYHLFEQSREQLDRFNQRLQEKSKYSRHFIFSLSLQ